MPPLALWASGCDVVRLTPQDHQLVKFGGPSSTGGPVLLSGCNVLSYAMLMKPMLSGMDDSFPQGPELVYSPCLGDLSPWLAPV